MLFIVHNPTPFEFQEVNRLCKVNVANPDILNSASVYLLYDNTTFEPIGWFAFCYHKKLYNPFILFDTTRFCSPMHLLSATRIVLAIIRVSLKKRCRVYIENERLQKFASACGFRQLVKKKKIWVAY